jgi:hypothetical protein
MPDTGRIETRLLIVAEMLDKAVEELGRVVHDIRTHEGAGGDTTSRRDDTDDRT